MLWFADDYGLISGLFSLIVLFVYVAFIYIFVHTLAMKLKPNSLLHQ